MAKYSAQKLKSVSLNIQKRRNANQDDETNPSLSESKSEVESASNNEPLMKPLSKKTLSEPDTETTNSTKIEIGFDWMGMFHRTFLSLYLIKNEGLVGEGRFNYSFQIGRHRLYVLTHDEVANVESPNVSKVIFNYMRQRAATIINKRFQQLKNRNQLLDLNDNTDINSIHYIGLTSLIIVHEGQSSQVEHEFGSEFFNEECVLDLDGKSKILQLFSLNSFNQMLKLLQTPSDLLSYFDYHLNKLVNLEQFNGEFELAQDFINSPIFYQRAIEVQRKLVEIGLLNKVESRLLDLTESEESKSEINQILQQQQQMAQKLQDYSTIFQKLLNGSTKRQHQANNTVPIDQVKLLVAESMYTRMIIIEKMMAYENRSKHEIMQGYMSHQHSYNVFGHHYVIVVYGLDNDAQYSRQYLTENYSALLNEINAQLQNPAMQEYFILGFDMSNDDGQENVTVLMDIYHQSGSVAKQIVIEF